jgi:hypothetical protein
MVSNFVGQQRFLDSLNIPIVKESTNWLNNGITAGYVKYFANNLIFTSIRNCGHFAPKDNPETCLKLLREFHSLKYFLRLNIHFMHNEIGEITFEIYFSNSLR